MDKIMTDKKALQLFIKKGYLVEYQEELRGRVTGNYNVDIDEHYADLSSSESDMYYYICDEDGYKLYNFEFTDKDDLISFIIYAMNCRLDLQCLEDNKELANFYREAAGVPCISEYQVKG